MITKASNITPHPVQCLDVTVEYTKIHTLPNNIESNKGKEDD